MPASCRHVLPSSLGRRERPSPERPSWPSPLTTGGPERLMAPSRSHSICEAEQMLGCSTQNPLGPGTVNTPLLHLTLLSSLAQRSFV